LSGRSHLYKKKVDPGPAGEVETAKKNTAFLTAFIRKVGM
jgi:hypothetical protein